MKKMAPFSSGQMTSSAKLSQTPLDLTCLVTDRRSTKNRLLVSFWVLALILAGLSATNIKIVHAENVLKQQDRIHKIKTKRLISVLNDSMEASGLVWDSVAQTFWLVSDEGSSLFALNTKGELVQKIEISGLEIDDAESISIDKESMYIAASVSFNKSGVLKNKRKKLVKLKRDGKRWAYHSEVDLYGILGVLAESKSTDVETRSYLADALRDRSIDVEAHQVMDNTLYLGFKSPLNSAGQSVILKVAALDALFSGKPVHAQIWRSIPLRDGNSGSIMAISDMLFFNNKLYITGVTADTEESQSGLWELDYSRNRINQIETFVGYKAEGIAIRPTTKEAIVVFDGGRKSGSHYTNRSIP